MRRKFNREFKLEAVKLVRERGEVVGPVVVGVMVQMRTGQNRVRDRMPWGRGVA